MTFIVVRARSDVKVERSIRETMGYMNLTRVNHAVIIPDNPQYRGMLQKAKDYITWGEADAGMVERMLAERGRMVGDAPLTDAIVAEHTDYKNISEFAKAITAGEAQVKDIPGLKRVFRLHPPRGTKGWGGIKRSFVVGGALGSRGDAIGDLVDRMI
ncbi:MAG: 50S ribosomal protein L30 [Candidatus Thermoplasmatota archaeon]|jgi:large subunit ribosomal protein L30|nr:50S ribosomal protein L30 [Candidatus Thermoplasmatota archaeon]GIR76359.1 MAG: 50S ribosomal protein L30 [Candidatus Poseidoniales archaeon]MEC7351174.1 50S ribosomal protein L30 [Candidatus Thermoplasmatota archaeon]MEC7504427.1 50S ribosomal protein L30 [Candidatus Thermoplasmatota archaeon]MEC7625751.1 50S ribosomal protein L30 [Candidatus Thermoplasmatota archaeon]|tara:strand:+ start:51 stop:521 length:471 start_codon:yes stop_codon:yes gene_type:complete